MSAPKKLSMERLSPIPEVKVQMKSSLRCSTPPQAVSSFTKDTYAIEMTSSPEIQSPPKSAPVAARPRRRWRESRVKRSKFKTASKNTISTPLSNFLSRRAIHQPPPDLDPDSSPSAQPIRTPQNNLIPIAESPHIDETPIVIDNFSPPKTNVTPRLLSGDLGFLTRNITISHSKYAPLSGIVVKKSGGHNLSLNVSADDVNLIGVDSDDENVGTVKEDLSAAIESYPSPEEQSKHILPSSSFKSFSVPMSLKSAKNKKDGSIVCDKKFDFSCVDMCDVERKMPKRALDFGCHLLKSVAADSSDHLVGDGALPDIERPPDDKLCESDGGFVIEDTPKSLRKIDDNDDLCGFTQCSKSSPDWEFPTKRLQVEDIQESSPKLKVSYPDVTIDDASVDSPPRTFKLPFELINDEDTLSDESNEAIQDEIKERKIDSYPEEIDDLETHPLCFDVTKKLIHCIESPAKKMFSEAVIDVAYSPDSHELKQNEVKEEETIETTTTTQEHKIEESEDVRPRKRFKKGTLVEQAAGVISRIKASQKLFEYEVKANLCSSSKKSRVSTQLVVCHKWIDDASTIVHICKPLKRFNSGNYADAEHSLYICILANETSFHIPVGAVVIVHFPITVIICSRMPYVLAGSKLVHQVHMGDLSERVLADRSLESLIPSPKINISGQLILSSANPTKFKDSMRVFSTCALKSVVDATFSQALVEEILFKLEILHVVSARDTNYKSATIFCVDGQRQPCMIKFQKLHDVKRAKALEKLHILDDGVHVEAKNFVVMGQEAMGDKLQTVFSYSCPDQVLCDVIYILTPCEADWLIVSSGGSRTVSKTATNFSEMSAENCGTRYLSKIVGVESCGDDVFVKDSSGCSLKLCCHDELFKNRCQSLAPPFILDGVFFLYNILHSDEYTTSRKV